MVFAHANMILGVNGPQINVWGKDFGNFICFALFLFCFAGANFIQFVYKGPSIKRSLKRIGWIYFTYLIVSLVNVLDAGNFDILKFLSFGVFYTLPSYGEFLVAFMLFEIISFLSPRIFAKISNNFIVLVFVSFVVFLFGSFLAKIDFGYLTPYTALIWGKENYYSFPFMQYFPIFMFGIFYVQQKEFFERKRNAFVMFWLSLAIVVFYTLFTNINLIRWSPNLEFILGNILVVILLVSGFNLGIKVLGFDGGTGDFFASQKNRLLNSIITKFLKTISIINKYTLHIFYFHIIFLFALRWVGFAYSPIFPIIVTLVILGIFIVIERFMRKDESIFKS